METVQNLKDWVKDSGLAITTHCVKAPSAKKHDDWKQTAFEWECIIKNPKTGRDIAVRFWMGSAQVQKAKFVGQFDKPIPPTIADILYSLCSEASACEQDFDQWCSDFGYDTDSRKALETYLACQESGRKVKALLGKDFELVRGLEH